MQTFDVMDTLFKKYFMEILLLIAFWCFWVERIPIMGVVCRVRNQLLDLWVRNQSKSCNNVITFTILATGISFRELLFWMYFFSYEMDYYILWYRWEISGILSLNVKTKFSFLWLKKTILSFTSFDRRKQLIYLYTRTLHFSERNNFVCNSFNFFQFQKCWIWCNNFFLLAMNVLF